MPNSLIIAAIVVLNLALLALALAGIRMLRTAAPTATPPMAPAGTLIERSQTDPGSRPVAVLHRPPAVDVDSLFSYDSERATRSGTTIGIGH